MNLTMILTEKYPDLKWKLVGNDYDRLEVFDGGKKPTLKELEAAWLGVKEKYEREITTGLDNKKKIDKKIRELAITALIDSGDLPPDYKE